ncbi:hypothetical protein Sste5346_008737 [Sporothrix stenoceras]|uniref:Cyanovirin-N domain-containing protein n=1 Tax=Sporothrix stenoceras TaxID=5173 RepID=A0ABR3YN11_9PEZI
MHLITAVLPLLVGVGAAIAEPPYGLRIGVEHGYGGENDGNSGGSNDHPAPPDPAFPFTDLCTEWRLEYLVNGGELSLWTQCAGATSQSTIISLLALDSSLIASKQGIKPAYPSNTAPDSFSSTCHSCYLPNTGDSIMACNCTANQGATLLAVDLAEWITAEQGVPCFTDGVVCGTVQSSTTSPPNGGGQEQPSSSTTTHDPECTGH